MARKFLYFIAFCIVVFIAGRLALGFFPDQLTRMAFLPRGQYEAQPPLPPGRYAGNDLWFARPGLDGDVAHWAPKGAPATAPAVRAAVFFVHPTSYLAKAHWNGPVDDRESRERAEMLIRGLASPFAGAAGLWIPRYRQAAFGAFLTDAPASGQALALAYGDVAQAFDAFVAAVPADQPIVLAGHSQGSFLLRRLIAEKIAGQPLARRIAAAYLIGWPISVAHDLPKMGLPACAAPAQPGCVVSWLSYGEPADPAMMVDAYARHKGLDGAALGGSAFLCSNPLSGGIGGSVPASRNPGTLVPDLKMQHGTLTPGLAGATCRADGILSLGGEPELGPVVLPGNNYHVYDIPLFWTSLREDYARRVAAWQAWE